MNAYKHGIIIHKVPLNIPAKTRVLSFNDMHRHTVIKMMRAMAIFIAPSISNNGRYVFSSNTPTASKFLTSI